MFLLTACSLLIASSAEESFQLLQSSNVRDAVEIGFDGEAKPLTETDEKNVEKVIEFVAKTDPKEAELLKKIQQDGSLAKQITDIQKNKALVQGAANQLGLTGDLTKGVLVTTDLIAKVEGVSENSLEKESPPNSPSDLLSQTLLSNEELKAEMALNPRLQWPSGKYRYCLDGSQNAQAILAIEAGIQHLEDSTPCVSFEEVSCSAPQHKAKFITGAGCYSYVGKVQINKGPGGITDQPISIGHGCEYLGIVAHEVLHSLGRFHEQSRDDRDSYVKIHLGNIPPRMQANFKMVKDSAELGTRYDLGSIMHYGGFAFARNRLLPTITDLTDVTTPLGNRQALTDDDKNWLNTVYRNSCTTR